MLMMRRESGFTLIELMIVVVIVAILAAVAYPSYQNSVQKGRRSDGMAKINEVMQAQETLVCAKPDLHYGLDQPGVCGSGIGRIQ